MHDAAMTRPDQSDDSAELMPIRFPLAISRELECGASRAATTSSSVVRLAPGPPVVVAGLLLRA
jgi:hypothetical protein